MVGLGRLERPTSPLSGVRSNHLSYRPGLTATPQAAACVAARTSASTLERRGGAGAPPVSGRRKRNEDGGHPASWGLTGPLCSKEIR
jgi:hypothetical protein